MSNAPVAQERILSTLNEDGTRRWLRPTPSPGHYQTRRMLLGWSLIALFIALPFVHIAGKPAILLDVAARQFTFFGLTLLPTDSVLLMLFMLGIFFSIFLLTALFGRVWCGWGCPQTVYLEFVYRPLERLIEGTKRDQEKLDGQKLPWRRVLKYVVYAVISVVIANIFLAYFVGVERLSGWVTHSPAVHPAGFAIVAVTSALMFLDFAWFREQMCVVACPYARLQAALLDKKSLIVAYDLHRGEPRGKRTKARAADLSLSRQAAPAPADNAAAELLGIAADGSSMAGATTLAEDRRGDCIDCKACVHTCPTGIDIREGLQLECVSCTQCIDACDTIMDKIGKPRGLIRYTSQHELETKQPMAARHKFLRLRVVLYPIALTIIGGLFLFALSRRTSAEVTILRNIGAPYALQDNGDIHSQLRVKIHNHGDVKAGFTISVDATDLDLVAPENPLVVEPGQHKTTSIFVIANKGEIPTGRRTVGIRVRGAKDVNISQPIQLLGPK
jgi:polyferredoxin